MVRHDPELPELKRNYRDLRERRLLPGFSRQPSEKVVLIFDELPKIPSFQSLQASILELVCPWHETGYPRLVVRPVEIHIVAGIDHDSAAVGEEFRLAVGELIAGGVNADDKAREHSSSDRNQRRE